LAYAITNQHTDSQTTLHISPSTCVHICTLFVSFAVFIYYFNCISFVIRLSGHKVVIKLKLKTKKNYRAEKFDDIFSRLHTYTNVTDGRTYRLTDSQTPVDNKDCAYA